jgi:hypothetical protein
VLNRYCGVEGCLNKPNPKGWCRKHRARELNQRYNTTKQNAKTRGIPFKLSTEEFEGLVKGKTCHYCHGELALAGGSLDRKNNRLGYTRANCVPCCTNCNMLKGHLLSYEETKIVVDILRKIRKLDLVWSKQRPRVKK